MENKDFIICLASYEKRINTIHLCLESLFNQTVKPKKIILYLDDSVKNLPKEINQFCRKGLIIIRVSSILKSHNKYYYSFKKYSKYVIITVDDDCIYEKDLCYHLMNSYKKYPNCVSASRVHYIMFDKENEIMPYQNWIFECNKISSPSMKLFATGVGGVLYPPKLMPKETFNVKNIIALSLGADDIWLKFMQIINHIPVVWSGQNPQHPIPIEGTKEVGLYITNKIKNDQYIQKLANYYNIDLYKELSGGVI